ncbi:MAG TPA: hypothetical protein VGB04_09665 [Allosphingosinicella sp.]|jgi:hypothetical protein
MIASLLLLAAQPAAAAGVQPSPAENEILVIGQRVRKIKFTVKTNKAGQAVCRIKRSSGDPDIDSLACDAGRACMSSTTQAAMVACVTPRFNQIPALIAARRRVG